MEVNGHELKVKNEVDHVLKEKISEIKPLTEMTFKEASQFFEKRLEKTETLDKLEKDYIKDLKAKSECAELIPDRPIDLFDLEKIDPEQNRKQHEEFSENKNSLIRQWEKENGRDWPRYKEDVHYVNAGGKEICLRHKDERYDAHHIQPLELNGKNTVDNITPLHALNHFDHRGVHAVDSPLDKLKNEVGGLQDDRK